MTGQRASHWLSVLCTFIIGKRISQGGKMMERRRDERKRMRRSKGGQPRRKEVTRQLQP
jgi:hypothetical protein